MKDVWQITVCQEFSAGHALKNYHGKCERLHGHNFKVKATVQGSEQDPQTGLILDFKTLKLAVKHAIARLDHQMLNELAPFDKINPSSENLARYIWLEIEKYLSACDDPQAKRVSLSKVSVSEKNSQEAAYLGSMP